MTFNFILKFYFEVMFLKIEQELHNYLYDISEIKKKYCNNKISSTYKPTAHYIENDENECQHLSVALRHSHIILHLQYRTHLLKSNLHL